VSFYISALWKKIIILMENSIFFRAIDAIIRFFSRLFSGSIFAKLLSEEIHDEALNKSRIYRWIQSFFHMLKKIGEKWFADPIKHSFVYRICRKIGQVMGAWLRDSLFYRLILRDAFPIQQDGTFDMNAPFTLLVLLIAALPFIPTMAAAALIAAIFIFVLLKLWLDPDFHVRLDSTGLSIVIYIVVAFFAAFTSFSRMSSIKIALLTSLFMFTYFLFISLVNTKEKLNIILFALCSSALVTGLVGLYQKLSGKVDMTWIDQELFEGEKLRVFSVFGNPNVYGEYLLLLIPIAIAAACITKKWIMKLYYLVVSAVLFANLGLTLSRGCYIGIAVAVFIFILFMEKRLITFFSIGIFALPFVLPASVIERLASITNLADSSTSYRISIWQATIRMIKVYWYAGVGQGIDAYNAVYPYYAFNAVSAPHSHSLYLQVMIETGIFGMLVFLAVLVCFSKALVPFFYRTKKLSEKIFAAAMMSSVVGFLVQGVFDYVFYNYKVFLMFFIVLAIGCAFVNIYNGSNGDNTEDWKCIVNQKAQEAS